MGNRSKYVAVTAAAAAAAAAARRRARLRQAMDGIRDTILPAQITEFRTTPEPEGDEAHAPGHQHLGTAADEIAADRHTRARRRYAPGAGGRSRDR